MKILVLLIVAMATTSAWAAGSKASKTVSCGVVYNAENKAGTEVPGVYEDLDTSKLDIKTAIGKSASSTDSFVKVQVSSRTDEDGREFVTVNVSDAKSKVLLAKVKDMVMTQELNLFVRLPEETRAGLKKKTKSDIGWAELWCSVSADDESAD